MPRHGRRTSSRTPVRLLATAAVAALVALLVALVPGTAAAAPNRSDPPDVVPVLDCVLTRADGSWTAVFGYDNRTGATVTIPVGPANQVTPTRYGTPQPTTFEPGLRRGVFAVTVTGGGPMWHLGSTNLAARQGDAACPPSTQMPADGNGAGLPIVLAAAGGAAALLLARARRRAVAPSA
ncbi:hypothetical protein [Geodermatophilus sp. FMUSA9-8]|uniref:hypothetical protein n=1 Tax=Geodermatophilus sp. FMUSA9-8 TaxID=3120155 RepID=UPI00300B61BF